MNLTVPEARFGVGSGDATSQGLTVCLLPLPRTNNSFQEKPFLLVENFTRLRFKIISMNSWSLSAAFLLAQKHIVSWLDPRIAAAHTVTYRS